MKIEHMINLLSMMNLLKKPSMKEENRYIEGLDFARAPLISAHSS